MHFVVFAQRDEPRVDLAGIVKNARQHFGASIEVLSERGFQPGEPAVETEVKLELSRPDRGILGRFTLLARLRTDTDLARARRAEIAGRAAGMAELCTRCTTVWVIHPEPESSELALHTLCAILASTALGPVLPPDDSTLYGVRGAMQRVDALHGSGLSR
ncbi:MAG: hypothetical protein IPI67_01110 [Myxococcales bacterium]|nr:hypothetical protein [Myxococcales bacterium]